MILFEHAKVDVPNLVTSLNLAPILELYVVRHDSKSRYLKHAVSLKEIGLRGQDILGLTLNMVGRGTCLTI